LAASLLSLATSSGGCATGISIAHGLTGIARATAVNCTVLDGFHPTDGPDVKHDDDDGVFEANVWSGEQGRDTFYTQVCDDAANGDADNDELHMGPGVDDADGGASNDDIFGGESPSLPDLPDRLDGARTRRSSPRGLSSISRSHLSVVLRVMLDIPASPDV
jgi:Ca2+-binding RTX toxin-like protein